jgi:quinoprotein dehydrogenase-associated probable ABC transporter substrate-binding protein
MCSRFLSLLLLWGAGLSAAPAPERTLRVCAEPNNLPFSNERREGFENRIAELIARELNAKLEYTWWSQRRSFVKNSLQAGRCDVLMGYVAGSDRVATSKPYYTSTYVIVSRPEVKPPVRSLYDPRLAKLRIGAHAVKEDFAPPVHALARRGIVNVKPYSLYGSYGEANPPARLLDALGKGEIDVALVWGPFAGYFAPKEPVKLDIEPVMPPRDGAVPFTFDIAIAVRRGDTARLAEIQRVLSAKQKEIDSILRAYGVPLAGRAQ